MVRASVGCPWSLLLLIILCHPLVLSYQILTELDVSEARTVKLGKGNGLKMTSEKLKNLQNQGVVIEHYLLIGSHDVLYNISLSDLKVLSKFEWPPSDSDTTICEAGHKAEKCVNAIKIILEKSKSSESSKEFLVCGTHAYKPKCKDLVHGNDSEEYQLINEIEGRAISPGDPDFVGTSVYHGDRLFSSTEYSGEPLIFSSQVRTQAKNFYVLKEPVFVRSMTYQDLVYFFFRELAMDYNCETAVFSRVARLCPNDKGGKTILKQTWTSFFKTRLECSIKGKFPFYFDEIQFISEIGQGNAHGSSNDAKDILYAIFSTPRHGLPGSAICAYNMSDIVDSFRGPFKEKKKDEAFWTIAKNVPHPHPASTCPNDSFELDDITLDFILTHPFMDKPVPSFGKNPIYAQSSFVHSLTSLAVDWQKQTNDSTFYDVIFAGTDTGRILKVFNLGMTPEIFPVIIEVLVTPSNQPIIDLKIITDPADHQKKLLIITSDEIFTAPLHRCSAAKNCRSCLELRDPYCRWGDKGCADSDGLQSLKTGKSTDCPDGSAILSHFEFNLVVSMSFFINILLR